MHRKPIAILGGMGPEASHYLYKLLINLAIKKFDAKNNDDFPEIILQSIPVPDFISNEKDKDIALKMLKERTILLNKCNISCLSIACNTAHLLLPELQKNSKVPFISMIDEVCYAVEADDLQKVAILGSPTTLRSGIYQNKLTELGITPIIPNLSDQQILEQVIRNIIAGKLSKNDKEKLVLIAEKLHKQGAEGVILGCTELPLLFPKKYHLGKIYNSLNILATMLLQKYYK